MLVTLIYLAVQVRQNTRSVRQASARQTQNRNAEVLRAFADHADVMAPFGFGNVAALDTVKELRHTALWAMWFQAVEQTLADVREGALDPEYATPYLDTLRGIFQEACASMAEGAPDMVQCFLSTGG